jgi:broad specificity phosphatase PhoE
VAVQLIYETHSTTRDNEAGIATGWLPGELSEAGVQNAADLGERRRDDGIDVIYASDLQRAVQSTQIALGDSGIPIRTDQRLRECNYGDLNGASVEALKPRTAYIDQPFPGGQSYRQVVAQTENFLSDLLEHPQRPERS